MADVKWIKITTDIFDDEKILLIESLPEADSIIVIWFKLLCLAGKQNNSGVFMMGNRIPYTDKMLSTIFRRKESTIQLALQTFESFGMIEIIDGVITIPNWGKHQNLDQLETKKEYMRNYMKDYREKQKALTVGEDSCKVNSKTNSKTNVSEADKKESKKEGDKRKKEKTIDSYYPTDEKLNKAFADYVEMRKQIKKPLTERAIELAQKKLEELSKGDNDVSILILEQSVMNCWQGLFPLKEEKQLKKNDDFMEMWRNA